MIRVGHGNGKRYQAGSGFHVTYRETNVFPPYIDNGSASAVVAGIHAEIILLPESSTQREHPIRTLLVGATLVRPECGAARRGDRSQRILVVGPTANCELSSPFVLIRNVKDGDGWKIGINRDGDVLAQVAGLARQRQPLARAECVRHTLAVGCAQCKVAPGANAGDRLRCGKRSQEFWAWTKQRDDLAVQVAVEFDSQD